MTVSVAVFVGLAATAFADQTNSTTDTTTTATATLSPNATSIPFGDMGLMMGDGGFGGGPGGHGGGGRGFGGYAEEFEVTLAYNQTLTNILGNDSDVQNLVSQGYTVGTIRPIVKSVIGADGTVTTQATTAMVSMQNGTSGYASVSVDITNTKVSQIVIFTRTVIDKTTT